MRLRLRRFLDFVRSRLPPAPARVLEVGCGRGEVALALADAGYEITAIDPEAPDGPIFRRVRLEDFTDDAGFDAVVASVSLHHVHSLAEAFAKIPSVLVPEGTLVLEEFAKERVAGATARWYYHQRQALVVLGGDREPLPDDFDEWLRQWQERHAEVHPLADLRRALDGHFEERDATWTPYLFDHWLHDAVEPLERELIASGAIEAAGFRYVGGRRAT